MPVKYKHLFFDLDRTLWDFEKSAVETFEEIFTLHKLPEKGISDFHDFHKVYSKHNRRLWDLYREGMLSKEILQWKRFYLTLLDYGIDDRPLAEKLGNDYLQISPQKVNLFPNALETLACLKKKYHLHLITNGFKEIQQIKISVSGMDRFFENLITSEEAGVKKPDPQIFYYALEKSGALPDESLMIGDDYLVDIVGARQAGIDQVFFDPENNSPETETTFKITDLYALCNFL
jgi:putative hydrolase of the HAD superfamily